jgi:hypothetical protein
VVAAIFWLSGAFEVIGWILFAHIREGSIPISDCQGSKCMKVFTCMGLEESTMHLRHIFNVVGGAVFGWFGFFGALNQDPEHLKKYVAFLVASIVVYLFVAVFDLVYVGSCGLYPTNAVTQLLLWPVPYLPISERRKRVIEEMAHYPTDILDSSVKASVFWLYILDMVVVILLMGYVAGEALKLTSMYTEGPYGTGANYTFEALHERALLKKELRRVYYESIASGGDAGEPVKPKVQEAEEANRFARV